ncbi:MAG: tetratricopeptide repeat protein [Alphaproteobacteria bacterium]|nr:tetratricopeptide repeat protein [Alphaproteobacteria bacterium]
MIRVCFALFALIVAVSPGLASAAPAAPDARARFQYLDTRLATQEAPLNVKPWTAPERQRVEAAIAQLAQAAPGLVQRAGAYRPVRVFRTDRLGNEQFPVGMVVNEHVLFVADSFFGAAAPQPKGAAFTMRDPAFGLARAVAHLADGAGRAAGSREWIQIAQPIVGKARAKAKGMNATLTELVQKGDESAAQEAGTPTTFATFTLSELLAQYAGALAVKKDWPAPAPVKAFVERRMLGAFAPEDAARRYAEGQALIEQGKFNDAAKAFEAAVKADAGFRDAHMRRGVIEKYRGDFAKAATHYDAAVKASNGAPPSTLLLERAFALLQLNQNDKRERAVADLTTIIDIAPGLGVEYVERAYGMRGEAQLVQKQWAKAAADFTAVVQIDPSNSVAWRNRGRARFEVKDAVGAIDDLDKAIQLDARDADAYFIRGYAYGSLKQYRQAKADLEETLRIAPHMEALVRPPLDFVNGEIAKGR